MTYQKFLDIVYNTTKEKDFYCWANAQPIKREEITQNYTKYVDKLHKINQFKQKVLTKALIDLPDDYFN